MKVTSASTFKLREKEASVPAVAPWASRRAYLRDTVQRLHHHRAAPWLALRTAFVRPGTDRLRRRLELRPGDPPTLAALAGALATSGDWRAFDTFLAEHEQTLMSRLSNAALARLAQHLLDLGWLAHGETLLARRLSRFPHSPVLGRAYARIGRDARSRGEAEVWAWVAAWHRGRARGRRALRCAFAAAGAVAGPEAEIRTEVVASGQGNLCILRHSLGQVVVVEKLVEHGSVEPRILAGFAHGRFRPPRDGLQVRGLLHVARDPVGLSLFFPEVEAPALTPEDFATQREDYVRRAATFNADNQVRWPLWTTLRAQLPFKTHAAGMETTLARFDTAEAAELRRAWHEVLDRRHALVRAWRRVPHVLEHGDLHGGNLLATDIPTLIDWENARIAPAGGELRTVLVMSGDFQFDKEATEALVLHYARSARAAGLRVTEAEVRLGLWLPYFAHHATASSDHPFELAIARNAIRRGRALLDG